MEIKDLKFKLLGMYISVLVSVVQILFLIACMATFIVQLLETKDPLWMIAIVIVMIAFDGMKK